MKNKILTITIILFCSACGNFLEPNSSTEFVPEDANALNEMLLGEAYPMPSSTMRFNVFLNMLDDDVTCADFEPMQYEQTREKVQAAYTWQSNIYELMEEVEVSDGITNLYKNYYTPILGCNAALDYLHTVSGTEDELNYVQAQALALRSFYYFRLVNIYGQPYNYNKNALGVPLKLNSNMETTAPVRQTVGEVYEQIVKDLTEAERLYKKLPENLQWTASGNRVNLPFVQLLLSRVYLYMENWEKAAEYAEAVISNPNLSLYNLTTIISKTSGTGTGGTGTGGTGTGNNTPIYRLYIHAKTNPEVIWRYGSPSDDASGSWIFLKGSDEDNEETLPVFKASDDLLEIFDKPNSGEDTRKLGYILYSQSKDKKTTIPAAIGKISQNSEGIIKSTDFTRSFRLAEAYLNFAEAKAMLSQNGDATGRAQAIEKINELRRYRVHDSKDISTLVPDAESLVNFIRDERRRELCFEDHRWFDLRRYGMPSITHEWRADETTTLVYTLEKEDNNYTIPLPEAAIEANTALVQNPLAPKNRPGVVKN